MNRANILPIGLLILSLAYPSCGQTIDAVAAQILDDLVGTYKDEILNSTQELIKIKSVAGESKPGMPYGEGPAQALDKVLEVANGLGFNTTNLDGYIGYAEFGQGDLYVAILAHVDVAPEGDGWTYRPYGGEIHDGKIYGRGCIDNKGPAISALYALKALKDSNLSTSKKVRVIFGTNEEKGTGDDVEHYLEKEGPPVSGFTPDGEFPAVFAEKGALAFDIAKDLERKPSAVEIVSIQSGTAPNIVPNKAIAEIRTLNPASIVSDCERFANETRYNITATQKNGSAVVTSVGLAAHGSMPYNGKNAAMQLIAFLGTLNLSRSDMKNAIDFLNAKIDMETDGRSFGLAMEDEPSGNLTFNVGIVNATDEHIALTLDIRYPVTHTSNEVMGIFNHTIEGTGFKIDNFKVDLKPLYYPKDTLLIRTLTGVYNRETGRNDSAIATGSGSYAKQMPNIAASGPLMPGQVNVVHQSNEYIAISDLMNMTRIYAQDIYELAK
jgi:succinyl-diaminopimelate desuccinylase